MDDFDPRLEVSICNEDGFYDLRVGENNFAYPGLVLIFNQIDFIQNQDGEIAPKRLEEPGIDLKDTMETLGFKVQYFRNLKRVQIMNTIGKFASLKSCDKKLYASFMLFFLSHGNMKIFENEFHEVIKTADDDMLISDTWKHFQCTATWNNKPKCFFFQTCRGMDLVEGVKVVNRKLSHAEMIGYDGPEFQQEAMVENDDVFLAANEIEGNSPRRALLEMHSLELQREFAQQNFDESDQIFLRHSFLGYSHQQCGITSSSNSIPFTEPKFSDLLIVHSTYQGASSFREPDYSPFINAVITNFRENFFKKDLFSIVQNIQKEIAYKFHASEGAQRDASAFDEPSEVEGSRLMPIVESTLTGKICYENPKDIKVASIYCPQELPKYYDMKNGKGKTVIFANKYKNMAFPEMPFVAVDVESLEKSFEMLNCEVFIHWDLDKKSFLTVLDDLGSSDFSHYDFLSVIFYGYGFKDYLILRDQKDNHMENYVEVAKLWQPFLGSRCPSLIDKPKFFIISANGIEKPGISGKFKRFVKKSVNIENTRVLNDEAKCDPGQVPLLYVIPEASDFLLLIHSAVGTAKYMDFIDDEDENDEENHTQSIFFRKLNEQLQNGSNFTGDRNLLDLIVQFQYNMTMVIKENVAVTRESSNKREVPLILSTLTKNFVLNIN